jgi:hypothetical protein
MPRSLKGMCAMLVPSAYGACFSRECGAGVSAMVPRTGMMERRQWPCRRNLKSRAQCRRFNRVRHHDPCPLAGKSIRQRSPNPATASDAIQAQLDRHLLWATPTVGAWPVWWARSRLWRLYAPRPRRKKYSSPLSKTPLHGNSQIAEITQNSRGSTSLFRWNVPHIRVSGLPQREPNPDTSVRA